MFAKLIALANLCAFVSMYRVAIDRSDDLYDSPNLYLEPHYGLRQKFIEKKNRNLVTAKRLQLLDKLSNDSIYLDEILHQRIGKTHRQWKQVKAMEAGFRNLIGMKGVKYVYRRDTYWRTWRRVLYPDGKYKVICYRLDSGVNCTNCLGYWVIEENPPPCSFELFSIIEKEKVCAINITNYTNIMATCPAKLELKDLTRQCINPVTTKWFIKKVYNDNDSKLFPAIVCGGREFCEILTIYLINRDFILFRIINSSNEIIYSRIMENGGINYACVHDCGRYNPITKTVSNNDKPLLVDLINNKNKREQPNVYNNKTNDTNKTEISLDVEKCINEIQENSDRFEIDYNFSSKQVKKKQIKAPSCQSLKNSLNDMSEDNDK